MSIIVSEDDLISISLVFTLTKNKYGMKFIRIYAEDEIDEAKKDEKIAPKLITLNTKCRPLTWTQQNDLFSKCTTWNPATGAKDIDWNKFRDLRLRGVLSIWDWTDESGRLLPVNEENIKNLHPKIADAISNIYDDAISLSEGEPD